MRKNRWNRNKKSVGRQLLAGALALCMTTGLTACTSVNSTGGEEKGSGFAAFAKKVTNLMEGIEVQAAPLQGIPDEEKLTGVMDFSVELLQQCMEEDTGKNTIMSPASVLLALAMTANGAKGETLTQMENVLGMSVEELNTALPSCLHTYENAKYKLSLANSIWFTEEESRHFTVNQEFLQTNAKYYNAEIYQTVFDDAAKDAINAWVDEKTDGMIKNILDKIPDEAIMYLVNAVAFDAEWQEIYHDYNVREDVFTNADGSSQKVEFMHSEENTYLEDENATGMLKYYSGRKYALVAMLPNEGMSVEEYIQTLDGAGLQNLLDSKRTVDVTVKLPKFTCEADYSMAELLGEMGMPNAFGELADFTGLGTVPPEYHIYISRVIHKAKIDVNEKGTQAGAATIVEAVEECAMVEPQERKEVLLDRPFMYMIIDCVSNLPIFMGTVTNLE